MSKGLLNNLLTIAIVLGFICNATITQFYPEIRALFILAVLILACYKVMTYGKSQLLIYTAILLLLSLFYAYYAIIDHFTDNAYLYCLILGMLVGDNIVFLKKILALLLIINFLIMLYEISSQEYFITIVAANEFEPGRYQGLFSYSKEASYFLVSTFLLFRHLGTSLSINLIFLMSSVLTGSRTSMIFIGFILVIDLFIKTDYRTIVKKHKFKYMFFSFIVFPQLLGYMKVYFKENFIIYNRIMQSFDTQSSGHLDRSYYFNQYVNYIQEYNIIEFFIGKGGFVGAEVGNGSENTWLTLYAETGLIGFLIYLIPMLYVSFQSLKKFNKYYPFILLIILMFFGRIALGWADGILLWSLISYIIYFSKKNYEATYIHTV